MKSLEVALVETRVGRWCGYCNGCHAKRFVEDPMPMRHAKDCPVTLLGAATLIDTTYWPKPIPDTRFDWSATFDGYDGGSGDPIGYGATEAEAIADLLADVEMRA